jgi:hypothetical protein
MFLKPETNTEEVPEGHAEHACSSVYVFSGHPHSSSLTLPTKDVNVSGHRTHALAPETFEKLPAAQLVHGSLPVTLLYLPVTHASHTPPSGPVKPSGQRHAAIALLELGDVEFSGHTVQALAPAAEYVPARHAAHTLELVAPATFENVPA